MFKKSLVLLCMMLGFSALADPPRTFSKRDFRVLLTGRGTLYDGQKIWKLDPTYGVELHAGEAPYVPTKDEILNFIDNGQNVHIGGVSMDALSAHYDITGTLGGTDKTYLCSFTLQP